MKQKLTISLLTEYEDGSFGKNEVQSMTRAEAVERMAKAICYTETRNKTCEGCPCKNDKKKSIFWRAAEAALDALLGGKK